jgi:hypothetical protein
MNSISWTVGHLAWQEQRYYLQRAQDKIVAPQLNTDFAYGAPMSTPLLSEMMEVWRSVTRECDRYLETLPQTALTAELLSNGKAVGQSIGSAMRRMTYHYWYHIGEIQAIRQMLGHSDLPEYVGDIETLAPYRPEE